MLQMANYDMLHLSYLFLHRHIQILLKVYIFFIKLLLTNSTIFFYNNLLLSIFFSAAFLDIVTKDLRSERSDIN